MRQKIYIISTILILISSLSFAQTTNGNYVTDYTARIPVTGGLSSYSSEADVTRVTQYYDGLGRPIQTVFRNGSPDGDDIVSQMSYDENGRNDINYLPYVSSHTTPGNYHSSWGSEIDGFYKNAANDVAYEASIYFSQNVFESNPLDRVSKTYGAGTDWRSADRYVGNDYRVNTLGDKVARLRIDEGASHSIIYEGSYPAGALTVVESTDENGSVSLSFTNKQGQVICKKNMIGSNKYASTNYLYNDFGLLAYVIQPEGIVKIENGTSIDEDFLDNWAFRYKYDARNRMIEKQVPGAAPIYMVYDKRDRLVLTQDGNQRKTSLLVEVNGEDITLNSADQGSYYYISNGGSVTLGPGFETLGTEFYAGFENGEVSEWTFTKYDALNRPVLTGITRISGSLDDIRNTVEQMTDFDVEYTGSTQYYGYDNTSYPSVSASDILTVTYYDTYDFKDDLAWGNSYASGVSHNIKTKGKITGSQVRELGGDLLKSISYYDIRCRPWLSIAENHLGGIDKVTTDYYNIVSPNVKEVTRNHTTSSTSTDIVEDYTYDHADRLLTTTTEIDGDVSTISNTYNELGELIEKDLNGVQSVDYRYNIRGWLTNINGGTSFDDSSDKFGMELLYSAASQYNGNIGRINWKNTGGSSVSGAQSYTYSYDGLNRLIGASNTSYSVSGLSYDLNGNILTLSREFGGALADELDYDYVGNQLVAVADNSTNDLFNEEYSEGKPVGIVEHQSGATSSFFVDSSYGFDYIEVFDLASTGSGRSVSVSVTGVANTYAGGVLTVKLEYLEPNGTVVGTDESLMGFGTTTDESFEKIVGFLEIPTATVTQVRLSLIYSGDGDLEVDPFVLEEKSGGAYDASNSEYLYDANGNMIVDKNKGITNISYNHLNLPEKVDYLDGDGNARSVTYTYDATGMKLKKTPSSGSTIDYIGGIHYTSGTLEFVQHNEGRYMYASGSYEYNLTDHLGNVRVTVDESGSVIQADDYYPFGLTFNSYTSGTENLYKYNGKEEQKELGLFDYGARYFDPALGRFTTIDPLASSYYSWSPYHYAANDPIRMVDIGGMGWGDGLAEFASVAINAAADFSAGVVDAVVTNSTSIQGFDGSHIAGLERATGGSSSFQAGQVAGDLVSLAQGGYEIAAGLTIGAGGTAVGGAASATGAGAVVGVPLIGASVATGTAVVTHGSNVMKNAIGNLMNFDGEIPKPPRGKGSVPPNKRDPKRVYSKKEKQQMLDDQGGVCAKCKESKTVDEVAGHHVERHADGGSTTKENGAAVCDPCHKDLHSK